MRRSWSAVSLGGGIVLSILPAERLGQDAPVQRLGGGEVEQPGQGRCDVHRADAPAIDAASGPGTRRGVYGGGVRDRKSTRPKSSHTQKSSARFCLHKKKHNQHSATNSSVSDLLACVS